MGDLRTAILSLQDEFDMTSFGGRLSYFRLLVHPRHALTSGQDVDDAKAVLEQAKRAKDDMLSYQQQAKQAAASEATKAPAATGNAQRVDTTGPSQTPDGCVPGSTGGAPPPPLPGPSASLVDEAVWTLAGAIHPDSGEIIVVPFRMAAWPFLGSVPVSSLMYSARYMPANLSAAAVGQWWNQSQNAATGYLNGAAACNDGDATRVFLKGYAGAVSIAMTIAIGAGVLVRKYRAPLKGVAKFLPFPAVAAANVCNTILVRYHEVEGGIDVTDAAGNVVGKSVTAAKQALQETCVTRVVLPAGNFVVAPILMLPLNRVLERHAALRLPACFIVTLAVFVAWLPVSLALYPQKGKLDPAMLEEDLAAAAKSAGVTTVYYNKGL